VRFPSGRIDLLVPVEGYRTAVAENITIPADGVVRVELEMERGVEIVLRLAEGCDPLPSRSDAVLIEAEQVQYMNATGRRSPWNGHLFPGWVVMERFVRLDEHGLAKIPGLGPGPYRFYSEQGLSFNPAEILVSADSSDPVTIRWYPAR
jgi:hypothetical protein